MVFPLLVTDCSEETFHIMTFPLLVLTAVPVPATIVATPKLAKLAEVSIGAPFEKIGPAYIVPLIVADDAYIPPAAVKLVPVLVNTTAPVLNVP